jgi:hypothetical protein
MPNFALKLYNANSERAIIEKVRLLGVFEALFLIFLVIPRSTCHSRRSRNCEECEVPHAATNKHSEGNAEGNLANV